MEKSISIANLSKALITFHLKVATIKKDARNPFFKTNYASLSNILEQIDLPLTESGLAFAQFPADNNALTTILIHAESGEYMQDTYQIHPVPEYQKEKDADGKIIWRGESYISPQAVGSAITYARRYALAAILGLNIEDDDDANTATHGGRTPKEAEDNTKPWLNKGSKEYDGAIKKLQAGTTSVEKIEAVFKLSKAIKQELISAKNGVPHEN